MSILTNWECFPFFGASSNYWIGKGLATGYDTMTELVYNTKFRDAVYRKRAAQEGAASVARLLHGFMGGNAKGDAPETVQPSVVLENYSFFGTDGEGGTGELDAEVKEVGVCTLALRK